MVTIKYSTKRGKEMVEKAMHHEGTYLHQVYERYSEAKRKAWNDCFEKYCKNGKPGTFAINSHNPRAFVCSWFTETGDLRIETYKNTYIIVFDEEK